MTHTQGETQSIETEWVQMLHLAEKSFKASITNIFKELNEVMLKIKRKII